MRQSIRSVLWGSLAVLGTFAGSTAHADDDRVGNSTPPDLAAPSQVAAAVDELILHELKQAGAEPAPRAGDDDFLRRVRLDLTGTLPSPEESILFGLDPDAGKRAQLIDRLLESEQYARNWSQYWREVIFSRATDMRSRLAQGTFEDWMADQLRQNRPWSEIATELLTATGDVREEGATALMFVHGADPAEIAAEASRIFLGIQIQCANCHDHPTDVWKREQFHELAAFFPRIALRQKMDGAQRSFEIVSVRPNGPGGRGFPFRENPEIFFRRLDRDRDGKLTKAEVAETPLAGPFDRILQFGDTNKDGAVSLEELRNVPAPNMQGRGAAEYFMPDLNDPASRGTPVQPTFFVNDAKAGSGLDDLSRRGALAGLMTSTENPWFARAYVNRIWAELLGEGFYMPVDDLGPERTAAYPEVLDLLSRGFTESGYDVRWLFRVIARTDAYQRSLRSQPDTAVPPFAAAEPTRLRSDQLFSALMEVLGLPEGARPGGARGPGGLYGRQSPRIAFNAIFGFDPSTPQEDIVGNIPQALFLMNSPQLGGAVRGNGNTRLGRLLREFPANDDAVEHLYLLVLSREPTESERGICLEYIEEVGDRSEAFEDLMWSLLNSSEFLTKR